MINNTPYGYSVLLSAVKPSIYLHTTEELSSDHNGYLQSIMTVLTIYSTVIVVNVILNGQINTTMITSDIIVVFFFYSNVIPL